MDAGSLLQTAVWTATPVGFAAVGETIAERSGMLNIGLEGMMLSGAFVGAYTMSVTGDPALAALAGTGVGALVGLLHALLTLWTRVDQVVSGVMLNLLASGGTAVADKLLFTGTTADTVPTMPVIRIPGLASLPFVGQILFQQRLLTYLLVVVAVVAVLVLTRTTTGLRINAAGEDPDAAALEGVLVRRLRVATNTVTGALTGLGGAFLTLGITGLFGDDMTAGRGFVALAMVIIGRWNPLLAVPAVGFFAIASAVGIQLQTSGTNVPFQIFIALPYVVTVLVMFTRIGNKKAPRELGHAWSVET